MPYINRNESNRRQAHLPPVSLSGTELISAASEIELGKAQANSHGADLIKSLDGLTASFRDLGAKLSPLLQKPAGTPATN